MLTEDREGYKRESMMKARGILFHSSFPTGGWGAIPFFLTEGSRLIIFSEGGEKPSSHERIKKKERKERERILCDILEIERVGWKGKIFI